MRTEKKLNELLDEIKKSDQQTFELQRKYIELFYTSYGAIFYGHEFNIIPEDKILSEIIDYAIKLDPTFLINLPKTKITYQNCVDAIKYSKYKASACASIISAIPEYLFDYNLCKNCVLTNVMLITKIPVRFITPNFILDLSSNGVKFKNYERYIRKCFEINENKDKQLIQKNITKTDIDCLNSLNSELNNLIEKRDRLNEEIEFLLTKIQEKENETKGKCSK